MSILSQLHPESDAQHIAAVETEAFTGASGDYVPAAISRNLEQRLGALREAAAAVIAARGVTAKAAAIERLTAVAALVAPLPHAGTSTIGPAESEVVADGVDSVTITVTLLDVASNPVPGRPVKLVSDNVADTISEPSGVSDAAGVVTFTVTSDTADTSTFTATASGDAIEITDTAEVVFTAV